MFEYFCHDFVKFGSKPSMLNESILSFCWIQGIAIYLFVQVFELHGFFSGLTNYPIGVGINAAGEVTIADNHNNFNLSVFSQVLQ